MKKDLNNFSKNQEKILYKSLIKSEFSLICNWFPDTTITFVNKTYCQLVGKTAKDIIEKKWINFFEKSEQEKKLKDLAKMIKKPQSYFSTREIVKKNGKNRWIEWLNIPIFDDNQKLIMFQSIGKDITGQKESFESIKEKQNELSILADSSSDIIFALNKTGMILYVNKAIKEMLGYDPEEVIGKHFGRYTTLSEIPKYIRKLKETLKKGRVANYEGLLKHKNKTLVPIEMNGRLIKKNNQIIIQGNIRDITERKKNEELLETSNKEREQLENIINKSTVVTFLWKNSEGWPVEYVSDNVSQFGYKAKDFYSKKIIFANIIHPDDLEQVRHEVSTHNRENKNGFSQEYRIITKSGKIVWVDDRTWIRKNKLGKITHLQGVLLDITDRKKAEEKIFELYKHLGVINRKLSILSNLKQQKPLEKISDSLRLITKPAQSLSQASVAILYKYNKKTKKAELISSNGKISEKEKTKLIHGVTNNSELIKKLSLNKKRIQGNIKDFNIKHLDKDVESFVFCPIINKKEFKGFLFLGFPKGKSISTQELNFYDLFLIQASSFL